MGRRFRRKTIINGLYMTSLQKRTTETPGARSFPSSLCLWELLQMLRLRAEALAERLEAPTGLGRMGDCGLKPSLSAWKPQRGYGVESWVRGRPRPHARRRRAHPFMEIEHLFRYPALAVGLKPSARRDEARLRGLERSNCSKTIKPLAIRDDARLRVTRTPTVMLSAIGYRLSAISYRLSAIAYRLSPIAYRLSPISYRLGKDVHQQEPEYADEYLLSSINRRCSTDRPVVLSGS